MEAVDVGDVAKWRQILVYPFVRNFSCPKVNFLLANDKTLVTFILAKRKFTFGQEEMKKTAILKISST